MPTAPRPPHAPPAWFAAGQIIDTGLYAPFDHIEAQELQEQFAAIIEAAHDTLRAENAALRSHHEELQQAHVETQTDLNAVIAYRDALVDAMQKIADFGPGHGEAAEFMAKMARKALAYTPNNALKDPQP